jgi:hypothetical protein
MTHVDVAARRLFEKIQAPAGTFNTLAFADRAGRPYIRVLLDKDYFGRVENIPKRFGGFRVSVEKREWVAA